jgi:hypothetical protein
MFYLNNVSKTSNCRGNLIAVGIWGLLLVQNSYLWSTADGGNPIVIATMLEKDIKFGN